MKTKNLQLHGGARGLSTLSGYITWEKQSIQQLLRCLNLHLNLIQQCDVIERQGEWSIYLPISLLLTDFVQSHPLTTNPWELWQNLRSDVVQPCFETVCLEQMRDQYHKGDKTPKGGWRVTFWSKFRSSCATKSPLECHCMVSKQLLKHI